MKYDLDLQSKAEKVHLSPFLIQVGLQLLTWNGKRMDLVIGGRLLEESCFCLVLRKLQCNVWQICEIETRKRTQVGSQDHGCYVQVAANNIKLIHARLVYIKYHTAGGRVVCKGRVCVCVCVDQVQVQMYLTNI